VAASPKTDVRAENARYLLWAFVWLAIVLVALKAYYLDTIGALAPHTRPRYLPWLTAISFNDILFALTAWCCGGTVVLLAGARRGLSHTVTALFLALSAFACLYAVANITMFGLFGGFLTYPLLELVGDVRMVRSSVLAQLTPRVAAGLVGLPLIYLGLVVVTTRMVPLNRKTLWRRTAVACASLAIVWITCGQYAYARDWRTRQDRRIAENAHWVLVSSWWRTVHGSGTVRLVDQFAPADLLDFEPVGEQPLPVQPVVRRVSTRRTGVRPLQRQPNVILLVLESVAARWTSLNGGPYETTPELQTEAGHSMVFDSFYAHIGRSSNSLVAMLLSAYPKFSFRDLTEEYPHLPGTSLASAFGARGYRTAFVTPSDLSWAGWERFLEGRGFGEVRDFRRLPCSEPVSSWGVEDRCMIEDMLRWIDQEPGRPFFLMGWSQQTHHPYEPTPGVPLLRLKREPVADEYDFERYLNVLHETDRHIGRLFDALRRAGLDKDTLVVVTGDHGQAFGYPHDSYMQGRTVYEEDVHVPLMLWYPRLYRSLVRSKTIGSHVDLAPTIADVVGLPIAPDWQGRSLFDAKHVPRAYLYVAEDQFRLGVREGSWKYIFDLREGVEELYNLDLDPTEQQNLARAEPERCARLRQRLAAWTEANRRQYERVSQPARTDDRRVGS
jgi:arylsulfatase A-like enzyme